jgi:hypothetical protein
MIIIKKKISINLLIYFMLYPSLASTKTAQDFGLWGSVSIFGSLSNKDPDLHKIKYLISDTQRNMADVTRFSQNLLLVGMGYAITPEWTLMGGLTHIYTNQPYSVNTIRENRIWEQARWNKAYTHFSLTSRSRIEQRFIQGVSNVPNRFREMLILSIPLPINIKLSFITSNEVFWNINSIGNGSESGLNGFSQNRFFIGFGYKFSDKVSLITGYLNQYLRYYDSPPAYMGNIITTNLNLTF